MPIKSKTSDDSDPLSKSLRLKAKRITPFIAVAALAAIWLTRPITAAAQNGASGRQADDDPGTILRDLMVVLVLILISGCFVMVEAAFLSVRRTRIEQLMEEGNRKAKLVHTMLTEPTRLLATLQVGLTFVQLFSAGEATNRFSKPLTHTFESLFPGTFIAKASSGLSVVVIILTVGLLTLVIGEVVPKSIAVLRAEWLVLAAAYPVRWLQSFAAPLVGSVTWISKAIVKPLGGAVSFHTNAMSEAELKIMVEQSEEHGVIEAEEKEMIHKVFDFADTVVRKVMTPRLDMTAIEADAHINDLIATVTGSGHSRIPVYDDNLDNIVGIVHVKDVLKAVPTGRKVHGIRDLIRKPYFIPENKRVDDLLREFRINRTQIAIVRDEYGTVTGLVTIEDLLEEIVGEIQDEYDVEEPEFRQISATETSFDGRMSIDDFNDRMGLEVPVEESDTLAGFVFGLLGHQPLVGESAIWGGVEFSVEQTDGKRIQKVQVNRTPMLESLKMQEDAPPADNIELSA